MSAKTINAIAPLILCLCLATHVAAQQPTVPSVPAAQPVPPTAEEIAKRQRAQDEQFRNDWGNLQRYREANAKLSPPVKNENRVVFLGNSITQGWAPYFATMFPGKPYIGRGIGGQTTPQMLVRFRQDVINLRPKVVVILAGTNDIAGNTGPMSLEDIEANYASLAELAQVHNIRVIFSSILPVHNYTPKSQEFFAQRSPEKILEVNRWLKDYCAENQLVYLDYFIRMVD